MYYFGLLMGVCILETINGGKTLKFTPSLKNHKNYDELTRNTKQAHTIQLDSILLSIEEKLHEIGEKQKQDLTSLRVSNALEIIGHRLQNLEEQIARAESYNKMRLEQLIEVSTMKSEFLIEQLGRRIEKNQQQCIGRLSELELSLEKTNKAQDALDKNFRKMDIVQNSVVSSLQDLNEVTIAIKSQTVQNLQYINATRNHLDGHIHKIFENVTALMERTRNCGERIKSINTDNLTTIVNSSGPNDLSTADAKAFKNNIMNELGESMKSELNNVIIIIEERYKNLQETQLILKTSVDECLSVTSKIYVKFENEQLGDSGGGGDGDLENFSEVLIQEIKSTNMQTVDKFEIALKNHIDPVLNEQRMFAKNCRRLQKNEEQIEDKVVAILQNLFNYIDNRTACVPRKFDNISRFEFEHDPNKIHIIKDISNFIKQNNTWYLEEKFSQIFNNISDIRNDLQFMRDHLLIIHSDVQKFWQITSSSRNITAKNVSKVNEQDGVFIAKSTPSDQSLFINSGFAYPKQEVMNTGENITETTRHSTDYENNTFSSERGSQ